MNFLELCQLDFGNGSTLGDYRFLYKLAKHFGWESAVETGSNAGVGTIVLCYAGVKHVTTIDIKEHPLFKKQLEKFGISDQVVFVKGDSKKVLHELACRFDVAYIDGDHTQAGVQGDIEGAAKIAKSLVLHDTIQCTDVRKHKNIIKLGKNFIDALGPQRVESNIGDFTKFSDCWTKEDDFYSWKDGNRNWRSFPGITYIEL